MVFDLKILSREICKGGMSAVAPSGKAMAAHKSRRKRGDPVIQIVQWVRCKRAVEAKKKQVKEMSGELISVAETAERRFRRRAIRCQVGGGLGGLQENPSAFAAERARYAPKHAVAVRLDGADLTTVADERTMGTGAGKAAQPAEF